MKLPNRFNYQYEQGFTLVELIVTIIIIGIMSVTVVPRFFTSSGFEEYVYRDELIIKLRAIQLRAMQQSADVVCQKVRVKTSEIALLATDTDPNTKIISCSNAPAGDSTRVVINDNAVSFTISESLSSFRFSSLGRPLDCLTKKPCDITLTVTGSEALEVIINSEGYIHAR